MENYGEDRFSLTEDTKICKTVYITSVSSDIFDGRTFGGIVQELKSLEEKYLKDFNKLNLKLNHNYYYDGDFITFGLYDSRLETDAEFTKRIKKRESAKKANEAKKNKKEEQELKEYAR